MIIRERAYPRAGLVGNPSDGYYGKTIALAFTNFHAEVILYETPGLEILPNVRDHSHFKSMEHLAADVRQFGYYGGVRLLKAAVKGIYEYCTERGIRVGDRNFTVSYDSNIPHMVGLAGSSAIITGCLKALMRFFDFTLPKEEQANLILAVERDELGISAGLQDRVSQVYQGMVYMDFDRDYMEASGHGRYEELDAGLLPNLYIAYRTDLSEGSETVHNDMRRRFLRKEPEVLDAILFWRELTDAVREALLAGRPETIGKLLDANFDRRAQILMIGEGNLAMVQTARSVGASAKFTGSGGAIIGTYEDERMFDALEQKLLEQRVQVIKPVVAAPAGD